MTRTSSSRHQASPSRPNISIPDISIVVPVMNEEGSIAPLITDILAAFKNRNFEIIYIDDASTDGTAEALRKMKKTTPNLRILTHSRRFGQSAAIRSGVLAAAAPLIATVDGDGQNPPSDLPRLEEELHANRPGLILAAGVRVKRKDGRAKRYASVFARMMRRWMLKDNHPDVGCGTKVFDRELFLRLPYFDHQHRFMSALARREGATVLAVPVKHEARKTGRSKYRNFERLMAGVSDIIGVMWLIRRSPKNLEVKE
jgi:dolichol-phosphate mannosyltransferase